MNYDATAFPRSATERKLFVRGVIRDPRRRGVKSRRLGKVAQMHDSPSLIVKKKWIKAEKVPRLSLRVFRARHGSVSYTRADYW